MKTLYIECNMGAAGDMLMSALLELHPNADEFLNRLNKLGIPNVTVSKTASVKCGITGTHIDVSVNGEHEDEHMHDPSPRPSSPPSPYRYARNRTYHRTF